MSALAWGAIGLELVISEHFTLFSGMSLQTLYGERENAWVYRLNSVLNVAQSPERGAADVGGS